MKGVPNMTDVFISYSKKNQELANQICQFLESHDVTCWIAPRNIAPGTEYAAEIIKGIEGCKVFLLIFSEFSDDSQHVLREVGRAVHRNVPFIAYRIQHIYPTNSMEYFLESVQWLNAYDDPYKHFDELLHSVSSLINKDAKPFIQTTNAPSQKAIAHKGYAKYAIPALACLLLICFIITLADSSSNRLEEVTSTFTIVPESTLSLEEPSSEPTPNDIIAFSESSPSPTDEEANDSPTANNDVSLASSNSSSNEVANHTNDIPAEDTVSNQKSTPVDQALSQVLSVGNYIQLGTYYPSGYSDANNDSKINWLVLNVDKSAGTAFCVSSNILDIKLFDGSESGHSSHDKAGTRYQTANDASYTATQMTEFFGNSDWSTSNIRTWLNSTNAQVSYPDQSPTNDSTSIFENDYAHEAGFLYHFSDSDKNLLISKTLTTPANALGSGSKTTNDKVFLLSLDEVKQYIIGQNLMLYAKPTTSAANSDGTGIYTSNKEMGYPNYNWLLRTPNTSSSCKIMLVGDGGYNDEDFFYVDANSSYVGIRPAVVINISTSTYSGQGTSTSPYIIG